MGGSRQIKLKGSHAKLYYFRIMSSQQGIKSKKNELTTFFTEETLEP
jgi:hypothetical protein